MTDILIEPPTQLAIPIETARQAIGASGDELDAVIDLQVRGITDALEDYIERKVMAQTWLTVAAGWPPRVRLPHPVRRVVSVRYTDAAGAERDIPDTDWTLIRSNSETWISFLSGGQASTSELYAGRILVSPTSPNAGDLTYAAGAPLGKAGIAVTVVAGMAETHAQVPPKVAFYVMTKLREHFDSETRDAKPSEYIQRLLDGLRVY